jgi:hypothetical protein
MMELRNAGVNNTISILLEQGQREGLVRRDLSLQLIIESFRTVVISATQPEMLESINLTASQTCWEIMELFFNGLLIHQPGQK